MRKLSKKDRSYDRGLPDSYDPSYFYEYRIAQRSKEATGIEGLVYKLMPWSLIRSFAFAIDPLSNFKTAPGRIQSVNRLRSRTTISVLDTGRRSYYKKVVTHRAAAKNYLNIPGKFGPIVSDKPFVDQYSQPSGSQVPLPRVSRDTTYRTRPLGYTMGEFEKSIPTILSPPRYRYTFENNRQMFSVGPGQDYPDFDEFVRDIQESVGPTAAVYRSDYYNSVRDAEFNTLLSHMQKHALGMYKSINPVHRNYSLFRNVVELRDLPRSILSMRDTIRSFSELEKLLNKDILSILRASKELSPKLLKNLSGEYLSYNFGWKQLVSDVYDLLVKPQKIQKQIDFLIRRAGKPTTYRTKRDFLVSRSGAPDFSYHIMGENVESIGTRVDNKIQLSMVVNTTFSFPSINQVSFRKDLYDKKLGVYPTFTDLYNLTPWTWLVDWFTGLGNYVEIIDEIHNDKSLINWGFITGKSSVDVTTTIVTKKSSWQGISVNGVGENVEYKQYNTHSSLLHIDLQLRKNVAGIFDVKSFSDPSSLSTYQRSILGALLAQRTNFRR